MPAECRVPGVHGKPGGDCGAWSRDSESCPRTLEASPTRRAVPWLRNPSQPHSLGTPLLPQKSHHFLSPRSFSPAPPAPMFQALWARESGRDLQFLTLSSPQPPQLGRQEVWISGFWVCLHRGGTFPRVPTLYRGNAWGGLGGLTGRSQLLGP